MSRWKADYVRVAIEGALRTLTPLHIGSGDEEMREVEVPAGGEHEEPETLRFNALLKTRAEQGAKPYLPGSTLRGLLRARCDHDHLEEILFGVARQKVDEDRQINWPGHAGQLRVFDAELASGWSDAVWITRTSIDPVTGAARQHHLATHETVPPGVSFKLRLELDHVGEWEVEAVLGLLATLGEDPDGQLGKGKSVGQGWVEWKLEKVSAIARDDLAEWLRKPLPQASQRSGRRKQRSASGLPQAGKIDTLWKDIHLQPSFTPRRRWHGVTFELVPEGPVLINDPHRVEKSSGDESPDLRFHRHVDGRAEIPGSTLKGWARGWCRRILLTLQAQPDASRVDELLAELFGGTEHGMGLLRFESALAENNITHRQMFNAVDRFSGGVKPGALYHVEAAWPDRFTGRVYLRMEALPDWARLLLLFLLRDAEEGDLVIGWGKAKGYGRLRLEQQAIDWKAWAEQNAEKLAQWQQALDAVLDVPEEKTEP